jgi:hypothetical protein
MMKFMTFITYEAEKTAAIAAAGDKITSKPPKGFKLLNNYACMSAPFPVPPNTIVSVTISEAENAEVLAAVTYPLLLAGATISRVPLMEVPAGASVKIEKKLRR